MDSLPRFEALKAELLALLTADLATLERAQKGAFEAATHEEAKPENSKDTRALEASYLARGHALRLEDLRAGLREVSSLGAGRFDDESAAASGALVTVEEDGATLFFFVAPYGGGHKLGAGRIQVVTPRSPIGRALNGKRVGDECEVAVEGRRRELSIVAIRG